MILYSPVSIADSCTVVVSGINRYKAACGEFRTNERKSGYFQFRIVLRREKMNMVIFFKLFINVSSIQLIINLIS